MAPGVVIPRGQRHGGEEEIGTPLTVQSAVLGFVCPVKWYDKQGVSHSEMVFVVGDNVYRDPNGEQWASELRTFLEPIAEPIRSAVRTQFKRLVAEALRELGVVPSSDPPVRALNDVDAVADAIYDETNSAPAT